MFYQTISFHFQSAEPNFENEDTCGFSTKTYPKFRPVWYVRFGRSYLVRRIPRADYGSASNPRFKIHGFFLSTISPVWESNLIKVVVWISKSAICMIQFCRSGGSKFYFDGKSVVNGKKHLCSKSTSITNVIWRKKLQGKQNFFFHLITFL